MPVDPEQARRVGRELGGRKPGQVTLRSRKRAEELTKDGKTPLDIMIKNMLFWHEQSEVLAERLQEMVDGNSTVEQKDMPEELVKVMKMFLGAQEAAQKCAVDAAPYMHPKLQSIAIQKEVKTTKITMTLPKAIDGEDRSYRNVGEVVNIKPKVA